MKSPELCRRLHITARELQWWCEQGLLHPRVRRGFGSAPNGHREFDEVQALRAAIVAVLRKKGLSLQAIRRLKLPACHSDYLVTDKRVSLCCGEDEIIQRVLASPRGCYVVCLQDLRETLNRPDNKNGGRPIPTDCPQDRRLCADRV